MASVRERKYADGLFWEGWYNDRRGKRKAFNTKIPVTGKRSKDAAIELTLFVQAGSQAGHEPFRPQNMQKAVQAMFYSTWSEFVSEKRMTVRGGTVRLFEQTARAWLVCMENVAVKEIDAALLQTFAERRLRMPGKNGKMAVETVNRNLRDVKAFLNWCKGRQIVERVPKIVFLKSEKPQLESYRPDEVRRLLTAARTVTINGQTLEPFLGVMLWSALRLKETLSLEWSDFDFRRRVVVLGGARTKQGKQVTVPLSRPLVAILKRFPKPRRGRLFPFSATSGYLREQWEVVTKLAGVRYLKLHAWRHTSAKMMVEAGLKPHQLKEILHASLATTLQYYVSADREAIRDAAKRIGASEYAR